MTTEKIKHSRAAATGKMQTDQRRLKGEATRERLLVEGIRLFSQHGYDGTNTRALAEAANCNLGLIAFHFGGKAGLYRAVVERVKLRLEEQISPSIEHIRVALNSNLPREQLVPMLKQELLDFMTGLTGREEIAGHALLLLRDMHEQEKDDSLLRRLLTPLMLSVEDALVAVSGAQYRQNAHICAYLLTNSVLGFLRDYPLFFPKRRENSSYPDTKILTDLLLTTVSAYFQTLRIESASSEALHV